MSKFSKHKWWFVTIILTAPMVALAGAITSFKQGTTISSSAVNKAFSDLDDRIAALEKKSLASLTSGAGISSFTYNGSTAASVAVDFGGTGSATTAARSDHMHSNTPHDCQWSVKSSAEGDAWLACPDTRPVAISGGCFADPSNGGYLAVCSPALKEGGYPTEGTAASEVGAWFGYGKGPLKVWVQCCKL
jgi:hypothetical protein